LSGARLNELCQLRTADVRTIGGRLCLDFTEFLEDGTRADDNSLKTDASERVTPVHQIIVDSGLSELVARRVADGEERLFPELRPGPAGGYSHDLSKWFGRYLNSIGLPEKALVFHSFRHGFSDLCRDAQIPDEIADALGGWKPKGSERAQYGEVQRVEMLAGYLDRITFGGFRLVP
jgi:integrase